MKSRLSDMARIQIAVLSRLKVLAVPLTRKTTHCPRLLGTSFSTEYKCSTNNAYLEPYSSICASPLVYPVVRQTIEAG